ncbi:MAG: hypothetical protein ACE5FH_06505 [Candidatus Zixiibacteriota bacterium]
MKRYFVILFALCFLLAGHAFSAQVTNIALSYVDGSSVARIDIKGVVRFTHQTEVAKDGRPYRIIVDVLSATHEVGAKEFISLPSSIIKGIRTSQYSVRPEKIVRIVFDMGGETVYQVNSNDNSIVIRVPDKGRTPFAAWSTSNVVTAKVVGKQKSNAVPVVATKGSDSHKSQSRKTVAQVNDEFNDDRLASLQGTAPVTGKSTATHDKSSHTAKPATKPSTQAKKTTVAKSVAQKRKLAPSKEPLGPTVDSKLLADVRRELEHESVVAAAKVSSKATSSSKAKASSGDKKTSGKMADHSKSVVVSKSSGNLAVKPKTTSNAKSAATKPPMKPSTKSTTVAKTTTKTTTPKVTTSKPVVVVSSADHKGMSKSTPGTKAKTSKSAPKPAPKSAVVAKTSPKKSVPTVTTSKPVEVASTSGSSVSEKSAKKPVVKSSGKTIATASDSKSKSVAIKAKPVAEKNVTIAVKPKNNAGNKKSAVKQKTNSGKNKVAKNKTKKTKAKGKGSSKTYADGGSNKSKLSTSRFRRSPNVSNKIKGTMVAEFPKRLTMKYKSRKRRDPFATLINETRVDNSLVQDRIPNVEGLRLVGVIEAGGRKNRALLEDTEGYGYFMKAGDKVRKGYVLRVEPDRVFFQIFEYGWSRTVALNLEER